MNIQDEHIAFHALTSTQRMRAWRKANPERARAVARTYAAKIRSDVAKLEARRENYRRYYHRNKQACLQSHRTWRELNMWASVADKLRTLVRYTLNGFLSGGPRFQLIVGCTGQQLRHHMESKWLPGMDWSNFGRGGWTVGHIKACYHFRDVLLTEEGQKACFNYTNLQPEWERSNLCKYTNDSLTPAQKILIKTGSCKEPPLRYTA